MVLIVLLVFVVLLARKFCDQISVCHQMEVQLFFLVFVLVSVVSLLVSVQHPLLAFEWVLAVLFLVLVQLAEHVYGQI